MAKIENAHVTVYPEAPGFKNPAPLALASFKVIVGEGGWKVLGVDFPVIKVGGIETEDDGPVDLEAKLKKTADGTWNDAGDLTLQATFECVFSTSLFASESTLGLALTSEPLIWQGETLGGVRMDASGHFTMAAKGAFVGGRADGQRCAVVLDGTFVPRPT